MATTIILSSYFETLICLILATGLGKGDALNAYFKRAINIVYFFLPKFPFCIVRKMACRSQWVHHPVRLHSVYFMSGGAFYFGMPAVHKSSSFLIYQLNFCKGVKILWCRTQKELHPFFGSFFISFAMFREILNFLFVFLKMNDESEVSIYYVFFSMFIFNAPFPSLSALKFSCEKFVHVHVK